MEYLTDDPARDTCDKSLANNNAPGWSDHQRRFLEAYRRDPIVSRAARLAGIHRATAYRWMADADFAAAMRTAAEEYFRDHRAKVRAEEVARQRWREARERARWPMRYYNLARARAAKR